MRVEASEEEEQRADAWKTSTHIGVARRVILQRWYFLSVASEGPSKIRLREDDPMQATLPKRSESDPLAVPLYIPMDDDEASSLPDKLAVQIADMVIVGRLRPGDRLDTIDHIARALSLSPTTATKIYARLAEMDLIVTRTRVGTTVRKPSEPALRRLQRDWAMRHLRAVAQASVPARIPRSVLLDALRAVIAELPNTSKRRKPKQ